MSGVQSFYIPRRVYSLLKCIYRERMTVITAPDGYGKSGTIREFVRRSRPDGYSCRFITDAKNANECFGKICRILFGREENMPTTASDFNDICRLFADAKPEKELVIILDCVGATDMLLGNLYCTWLFLRHSPIHIVLVTSELSYFHKKLADSNYIPTITEGDLALNASETAEFLSRLGADSSSAAELCRSANGEIAKIRLYAPLMKEGITPDSYDLYALIKTAVIDKLDHSQTFAAMCVAAIEKVDDKTLELLHSEPALCDYFDVKSMTKHAIFAGIRHIFSVLPLVHLNERTGSWQAHIAFKRAVYLRFMELPEEVRKALHRCSAKIYLREKKTFRAFCQYYLSGDIYAAASPEQDEKISFDLLMRSKDFLLSFAENCPLDCKPIIPRLLRILALLMLTPYRDRIKYRFDDVISYISASGTYTAAEKRNTLCYAYALRTYEDFYLIEKMGNHIKRAYDLYTGTSIGYPPFYTWGMYAPSIFCLIHCYRLPIRTEAEQFARYQTMYSEMIHHGEHVVSLYNAEIFYFMGDPANALPKAQEVALKCSRDLLLPTRIGALNTVGKSALMLGNYDIFTDCTTQLADIMKRYSSTELGDMAALCLALLCCLRNGTDEDIWRVSSIRDEDVLLNRYTAPFYLKVRCYAMLSHKEYRMLLSKKDYYLQACDDVRSETMALSVKLSAAIAHYELGENEEALTLLTDVLQTLGDSGVIMPAVEHCLMYPSLFETALQQLPHEHSDLLQRMISTAAQMRRGMIAVRTRELTELDQNLSEVLRLSASIDASFSALEPYRKELGLTRNALKYALYAARRYTNEQIAEICQTSVNSVKSSLKRTFAKLGIRSRGQLKYIFKLRE